MEIKEITNKNYATIWDNFIIQNSSPASFLQSWDWGEFKKNKQQSNLLRYAIYNNSELIAVAQFFKVDLPGGNYYFNCPKGPVISKQLTINNPASPAVKQQLTKILKLLIQKIKKNAKQGKIVFFRIAPSDVTLDFSPDLSELKIRVRRPKILVNLIEPENTLVLNLENSEEELLACMHQKTRYNIRLADKRGIKVNQLSVISDQNINVFYNLLKQTAKRDKINIFDKDYYNKLLLTPYSLPFTPSLFIAEHDSQPLAAIIVIGFGDTATYLYGASSNQKRELMPNYLIQWSAIKWSKTQGYKYYDFWGTDEKKWPGITRFKKGFGGKKTSKEIEFPGNFDYVLNKNWYNLYRIGKFFRR